MIHYVTWIQPQWKKRKNVYACPQIHFPNATQLNGKFLIHPVTGLNYSLDVTHANYAWLRPFSQFWRCRVPMTWTHFSEDMRANTDETGLVLREKSIFPYTDICINSKLYWKFAFILYSLLLLLSLLFRLQVFKFTLCFSIHSVN